MLALALTAFGGISVAQAATGGASGYGGFSPGSGSAEEEGIAAEEGLNGEELSFSPFRFAGASWYGPGLYGRHTACGQTLGKGTLGVAHRRLPCGTAVKFVYHGKVLITRVIDRGPYVRGRAWDLTEAASERLGFEGVGRVRYAVAREYARGSRVRPHAQRRR